MRTLIVVGLALFGLGVQERADLATPKPIDSTVRSYEIIGLSVQMPPTIFQPVVAPAPNRAAPVPSFSSTGWNLTIRYLDNLGTEYIDAHQEGNGAEKLVEGLVFSGTGTLKARLLQHLIDEGKIGPAKVRTTK